MHQGQHFSLPNCEVVQSGVKLLRLDCVARGERGKRQNCGVASGGKTRQRERYGGWGGGRGGGGWCWEHNRGEETRSQTCSLLVPAHFILLSFFSLLSVSFASHSPLPRWSFGPLVWRRYKAVAYARLPNLWYWFCQNCHCIIFVVLCCLSKRGQWLPLWNIWLH